jgi:hypothetical protein
MKIPLWIAVGFSTVIIISCASFPTQQLSFDLSKETVPVMLTPVKDPGKTKIFQLSASYASSMMTSSSHSGSSTVTQTMSESHNENQSLSVQAQNLFIQDPLWIQVSNLDLSVFRSDVSYLFGSFEKIKYTTNLEFQVPVKGSQK